MYRGKKKLPTRPFGLYGRQLACSTSSREALAIIDYIVYGQLQFYLSAETRLHCARVF